MFAVPFSQITFNGKTALVTSVEAQEPASPSDSNNRQIIIIAACCAGGVAAILIIVVIAISKGKASKKKHVDEAQQWPYKPSNRSQATPVKRNKVKSSTASSTALVSPNAFEMQDRKVCRMTTLQVCMPRKV